MTKNCTRPERADGLAVFLAPYIENRRHVTLKSNKIRECFVNEHFNLGGSLA